MEQEEVIQQVKELVAVAPKEISNEWQFEESKRVLVAVVAKRKKVEAIFEDINKPFKVAMKNSTDTCKKILDPILELEDALRGNVDTWQEGMDQGSLQRQMLSIKAYEEACLTAHRHGMDTSAIAPPALCETQGKTHKVDGGSITFKKLRDVVIVDASKIPHSFYDLVLNKEKVKRQALAGIEISGVVVKETRGLAVKSE